ncbi:EGF domain-specific O-linked N-acetylglucosamine transferase-like [Chenopodium quinoa]|uniref:EGF domain-specific O-linked N-acetylglucosamine transferase-like n=1 Tax=Chenopodium quinoa TaxID=63459 RepID=UPI000B76D6FA|nr:EGF domain-specific O-linked N-acetylglucosamine transferase-like [Chenopodium quinoa]
MVYFQKYYIDHLHNVRKVDETITSKIMKEELRSSKRKKSKLYSLLCLSLLSCSLIWVSQIFGFPFSLSCTHQGRDKLSYEISGSDPPIASSASNGTIYCDRSHFRTDVCFMKGDIRTNSSSSSIFLYSSTTPKAPLLDIPTNYDEHELQHETIKPYTRKWETSVMNTIDQLHLISKHKPLANSGHKCNVTHHVPAIFFSTGGYTGNVYHEFNDGIIPLYITSQHFNKEVVFVILEYHTWWYTKYSQIISQLSNYPPIIFNSNSKTHCFQEAVVGLKIHNELTIDSSMSKANTLGFRNLLSRAFHAPKRVVNLKKKPRMVLLSRSGSRGITNEHALIKLAKKIGFSVHILKPNRNTELGIIYKEISSSDVMIGVHGAAMTHFLFLEKNRVLVQVIPLGTDWASENYYGEPAKKMGLKYIGYKIHPRESSLYYKYDKDDPVLSDPNSVNKKGWEFTKKVYLDDQNVRLDLKRFGKLLVRVYDDYFMNSRITTKRDT